MPKENNVVFNTYVIGNQNVINAGACINQNTYKKVVKADLDMLLDFMKQIGISNNDIIELRKAMEEDTRTEPNKLGSKVVEWVSKMTKRILEGRCRVIVPKALTLIIEALFQYYGLE